MPSSSPKAKPVWRQPCKAAVGTGSWHGHEMGTSSLASSYSLTQACGQSGLSELLKENMCGNCISNIESLPLMLNHSALLVYKCASERFYVKFESLIGV